MDGVLPDLGFVEGCCDARQSCLNLLPYVGPGWYPKVSLAAMLDLGVCRWDHIVLGISARSHVDAATLRRALERMDAAWPEGEEHMAKLSVNAMIGLWARSTEVVYSVRSSSSELDGAGADFSQAFAYEGGMVWDFVYARRLLSNGRLLEGDALVLSALEIIAHFDPLMWVIENPATGLLKTRPFMERLLWVDVTYCKYAELKQTRLWTNMRWRPRRGPAAAAARGRTAGTSGPRSGGRG